MRSVNAFREVRRPGEDLTPSIRSSDGSVTLDAGIDVLPFAAAIAPSGAPGVVVVGGGIVLAAVTTAVCDDVAEAEPSGFDAVTTTRSVFPTSPVTTLYVCCVAPEIDVHALPRLSHCCHWYVNVGVV